MIIIKRIKNKAGFFATAAVLVICLCLGGYAAANSGGAAQLSPAPTHTVFNYWRNSNGKRCNLTKEVFSELAVYQATLPQTYTGEYLVLKTKNAGVSAYTGGKVLYTAAAAYGIAFHFIPVEELDDNSTVILHLTPYRRKLGTVTADVKLANKNDYLLTLLVQNRGTLVAVLCLLLAWFGTVLAALCKIKSKKHSGFGDLYLAVFLALWMEYLIFRGDLAAFTPYSQPCCLLLKTASLLLMPIPLVGFIVSKMRLISRNSPGRNRRL